jgi:hypothetical protein
MKTLVAVLALLLAAALIKLDYSYLSESEQAINAIRPNSGLQGTNSNQSKQETSDEKTL